MSFLRLSHQQMRELAQLALDRKPYEVCGLIVGIGYEAKQIIPIDNISENPALHYQMEPTQLLQALKSIDEQEQQLLAIFHSHPNSDPIPSPTDVAEWQYPKAIQLIISLKHYPPRLQAWEIKDGQVNPVDIVIDTQSAENLKGILLSNAQKWAIMISAGLAVLILLAISFSLLPPAPLLTPTP